MDSYLKLFEGVIEKQAELIGREQAYSQAKRAELGISDQGKIVSASGNPHIILLRLVKVFTANGNLQSLEACTPLINEFLLHAAEEIEIDTKASAGLARR